MKYLCPERMDEVDTAGFQHQKPFPWTNPRGLLHDAAYQTLADNLPDIGLFEKSFGKSRKFGQKAHDRYNLEFVPGLEIPEPWREFIEELTSERYRDFLARLLGRRAFRLRFHWHYAPAGASVSPHCDSSQKLGSHLFYLNPTGTWKAEWGGGTVALDDGGRLNRSSAPDFEDFDRKIASDGIGNTSFLFQRTDHSWHGVEEIRCPEEMMRRAFIVVIDGWSLSERLRSMVMRPDVARY
jgi:hypothetical protein